MQIIVIFEGSEDMAVVEAPPDADVFLLLQLIAAETGKNIAATHYLEAEGRALPLQASLVEHGVFDGSTVLVKPMPTQPQQRSQSQASASSSVSATSSAAAAAAASSASNARSISLYDIPADVTPEQLLQLTKTHPHLLRQIQADDSELGETLASQDLAKVRALMMKRFMNRHKQEFVKQQEIKALEADPTNPELQKKIEERIRLENIQQNMEMALENLPEAFARVTMLYVDLEVNNVPIKAFVDSGAQSTIMSMACAERCGVTRLIDTRFAGQARGVGTAKILGRIHIAQMKFGASYFPISITVLENNDVDFLFGLDMLRRYRCNIDLAKNVLAIEGANGREEIPFLSEGDLPENARGTFEGK